MHAAAWWPQTIPNKCNFPVPTYSETQKFSHLNICQFCGRLWNMDSHRKGFSKPTSPTEFALSPPKWGWPAEGFPGWMLKHYLIFRYQLTYPVCIAKSSSNHIYIYASDAGYCFFQWELVVHPIFRLPNKFVQLQLFFVRYTIIFPFILHSTMHIPRRGVGQRQQPLEQPLTTIPSSPYV